MKNRIVIFLCMILIANVIQAMESKLDQDEIMADNEDSGDSRPPKRKHEDQQDSKNTDVNERKKLKIEECEQVIPADGAQQELTGWYRLPPEIKQLIFQHGIYCKPEEALKALRTLHLLDKEAHEIVSDPGLLKLIVPHWIESYLENAQYVFLRICTKKQKKLFDAFLKANFNINYRGSAKQAPLHMALIANNQDFAHALLDQGAHIDGTLLCCNNKHTTKRLLQLGALKSTVDSISHMLLAAVIADEQVRAKALLDQGARGDACDKDNISALMFAVNNGSIGMVQLLLDYGAAFINSAIGSKRFMLTPLGIAIRNNHIEMVIFILEHGINIHTDTHVGVNQLAEMIKLDRHELVVLLIERGINVNVPSIQGKDTPLMAAAQKGQEHIVQLLLKNGANKEVIRFDGQTALSLAQQAGHTAIIRMLEEAAP